MTWITKRTPWAAPATPLTDRAARLWSVFVLAYLAFGYWLFNYALPGELSADTNVYVVRPAVWGGLGMISFLLWRRVSDRPFAEKAFVFLALLAGAFSVSVLICAGVLFSFGHSPYARDAFHMTENVWYLATFIFGLEMSRSYQMAVWSKFNTGIAFTVIALIYAAVWLAPGQFENLTAGDQGSLHTAGRTFMPGISESVMATFLVSLGGPLPAFIYHMSLEGFRWLSPILPKLSWTVAAFIGTLAPAVAMLIVRDAYFRGVAEAEVESAEGAEAEAETNGRGVSPLLLLAGGLLVAVIWLNAGMLGVTPYLVSGPSMKPGLGPGDLVIAKSVDTDSIEIGDIVRFSGSGGYIIHRVVKIDETPDGRLFTTKGDNNNVEDPSIPASRIEGKVIFDVPYIGWVPIKLKDLVN